jgi:hypothetical protein
MNYSTTKTLLLAAVGFAVSAAGAQQLNFETIPGMYPLDMSADGSVIVGNDIIFDAVRWTQATGIVALGRGTNSLGGGAGTPDISDDGTRISATITTADGLYITQGIWTEGSGWEDLMPPAPADGGLLGNAYGSAWGLSGDGDHVVGLYWRPGHFDTGSAHASFSDGAGNIVDLGSSINRDSRANHANFDGSVVVGWDTAWAFGYWSPTVWDNGVLTHLNINQGWAMANFVTPNGNTIGGDTYNETFFKNEATVWTRNGNSWDENIIGTLLGTVPPNGVATVRAMSANGSIAVGYNQFSSPINATGFIWTAEDGMQDIVDWLADHGVTVPGQLNILDLTSISADGTIMAGIAISTVDGMPVGFIVSPACIADLTGDGELNFFDVSAFLSAFASEDPLADFTDDGIFNFFDVSAFLSAFNAGCP